MFLHLLYIGYLAGMARYPIKIFINLKNSLALSYSIKANKGTLVYELKTKTDRPLFSKTVVRSSAYEIDLIQDALNSILHNAKPDMQSANISRLVYAIWRELPLITTARFHLQFRTTVL